MIVVWGEKLYGKVDHVPGLFYVSTKFFYLQYLPLIPLGSVLVLDGSEKDNAYRGAKIGLSGKSVLFAWLRTALIVGMIVLLFVGIAGLAEKRQSVEMAAVGFGGIVGLGLVLWASYRFSRPGAERAVRLAS